jgi:glycosyltransferase involved in cell wall biosynthesis
MPDLDWNRRMWNGTYNWEAGGEEWSGPWGGSEAQWFGCIYPRIHRFLPADRVLEIAPGCGRWTKFLLPLTNHEYVGIDLSQDCVNRCHQIFRKVDKASFVANDGLSLGAVPDEAFDFVFSFESLIYSEIDVLRAYVPQILRKLRRHGVAFIHHSNGGNGVESGANQHRRAMSVSAEAVATLVQASGGMVVVQELLNWSTTACTDCFSLLCRADGRWAAATVTGAVHNPKFMVEAEIVREAQSLYSRLTLPGGRDAAGERDPLAEGARVSERDPLTEGARVSERDPLAEGARVSERDPLTEGATVGERDQLAERARVVEGNLLAERARVVELEAQVRVLDACLAEFLRSRSWRVTAPLRALMRAARRIGSVILAGVRGCDGTAGRADRMRAGRFSVPDAESPGELGSQGGEGDDERRRLGDGARGANGKEHSTGNAVGALGGLSGIERDDVSRLRYTAGADGGERGHHAGSDELRGGSGEERQTMRGDAGPGFNPSLRFTDARTPFEPEVTVIVPNYNHARYLAQRLDSVYGQTYKNFTVVLLDDGSTDESRTILEAYRRVHPTITGLIVNEANGGSAFAQWRRGVSCARGELIWIAESDDYCDANFLQALVPWFADEAVQLAYSRTVFVGEDGQPLPVTFESYVDELGADRWQQSYVETTHREVSKALGRKNSIPNVSGVVFRKPNNCPLLEDRQWQNLRICGDWILYLHLARGGKIAFSDNTINYHRYHSHNLTLSTYRSEAYYREHGEVAATVARLYNAPAEVLDAHFDITRRFWQANAGAAGDEREFTKLYEPARVKRAARERRPNILMVGVAFSSGGGEIVPIRLAAALKEKGYGLVYFDFQGEPANLGVRKMLPPDIPIIEHRGHPGSIDDLLEGFGIEIVHTHNARTDLYFVANIKDMRKRVRHVATLHGMYEAQDEFTVRQTLPYIVRGVDMWVYVADKNLEPFVELGLYRPERFTKIGNAIAPTRRNPINRETLGMAGDAFVVCLASRAIPEKGWREAVAMTDVARASSGRDVHLVLLGEGPVKEALQAEVLPPYVHLLGWRENPVDYFAMTNLGLLPSRFRGESFPLSVMECLAAGRPVIASDVGEVRSMLTSDEGELAGGVVSLVNGEVPIAEVGEMIAGYARDAGRYEAARRVAKSCARRFSMERAVEQYAAVYERTMVARSGGPEE